MTVFRAYIALFGVKNVDIGVYIFSGLGYLEVALIDYKLIETRNALYCIGDIIAKGELNG